MSLIIVIIGLEPPMHVYSSEAYPFSKQNASLAIITSVECISGGVIQIVLFWPKINKHSDIID